MAGEFTNVKIQKVAIHKIFKRESKDIIVPPQFNESCTQLGDNAKHALVNRITRALGSDSHALQMDIEDVGEKSVYKYLTDFWMSNQDEEKFINLSKELTLLLASAQNRRSYPDGIVIILKGTTKAINVDYIAIIKAEISDGFNIENNNGENLLQYVNNLLLTGQQKLHKIGFFINTQVRGRKISKKDVLAYLFDSNTAESVADAKSAYFYKSFLGLKFKEDSAVITNRFYTETKKYIHESALGSMEKVRLQTALHNYLVVQETRNISLSDFADEYLVEDEIKDDYLRTLEASGVPRTAIRKDISMMSGKTTRKLTFENAIKLWAPVDDFEENVLIKEDDSGNTIITIRGKYING